MSEAQTNDASLRKQVAEAEAAVAKMRDKLNLQRDQFDERVAKLTAETRDTNERALRERQGFQNVRGVHWLAGDRPLACCFVCVTAEWWPSVD